MAIEWSAILTLAVEGGVEPETLANFFEDDSVTVSIDPSGAVALAFDLTASDVAKATQKAATMATELAEQAGLVAMLVGADVKTWEAREVEVGESNFPDLVSAPEVGEVLGVTRQRVHQLLAENPSFPPPVIRLGSGPLWLRSTIEAWAATPRRPGRPRATG